MIGKRAWYVRLLLALGLVVVLGGPCAAETVLVDVDSPTLWLSNEADPGIGGSWTAAGFDDSGWSPGTFGIGFDTIGSAAAVIGTSTPPGAFSVYTRTSFDVVDPSQIGSLLLGLDYDDGAVVWLNGVEVYRTPTMLNLATAWDTQSGDHESGNDIVPWLLPLVDLGATGTAALVPGTNVLAIGVWNSLPDSTDLVLVPQLRADAEPGLARGPYLQRGGDSRITIRWRTEIETDARVAYGTDPANLTLESLDASQDIDHEIELTGLDPDTRYYYAVGSSSELFVGGDSEHSFVTTPPAGQPKPLRIWAIGDSGTADANAIAVRDAYTTWGAGRETDLWLMLGDNAYGDGTDAEYQAAVFEMYPELLRRSVLWPAVGNHDTESDGIWPYLQNFSLPRFAETGGVTSGTELYYSFDHANVHFVVLDSMYNDRDPLTSPMYSWLVQDLAATNQQWIIAFWHHPPYSKGTHDSDNPSPINEDLPMVEMRQWFVPLLESHGVDLVLSGHSHSYERSALLAGHHGFSWELSPGMLLDAGDGREDGDGIYSKPALRSSGDGAVYTVAGNAGKTGAGAAVDLGGIEPNHPAMVHSILSLGSVVLDINGNRLDATFIDDQAQVRDRYTIIKGTPPVLPVADFVAAPLQATVPVTIDFTDQSSNEPTSWSWDVDNDGQPESNSPSPSISFEQPGSYEVRLEVANFAGSDALVRTEYLCLTDGAPDAVNDLRFTGPTGLEWQPNVKATTYDVVRGDLFALRASAGDFGVSQLGCDASSVSQPALSVNDLPAPNAGLFWLVRGVNCVPETGTYDVVGQADGRDDELQGPGSACACPSGDDADGDGWCNAFDNCPLTLNGVQLDSDGDGAGDACDPCAQDPLNDTDGDGRCGDVDNCPVVANPAQADADGDGDGDDCDPCTDLDDDGFGDPDFPVSSCPLDNCPALSNPLQLDADGDLRGDGCDNCQTTSNNDQADFDNDGSGDVCDECTDLDGDGFGNVGFPNTCPLDNCGIQPNPSQLDSDGDGTGDACDFCEFDPYNDADMDFVCGDVDNCLSVANSNQADADLDGEGDACDSCTDTDDDGFGDPTFPGNSCPLDNCPERSNPTQSDLDGDGNGDTCDLCPVDPLDDADGDGFCANFDNCPTVANPNQRDRDEDGLGNACDTCPDDPDNDIDSDGYCTDQDNCPIVTNPGQEDDDLDGIGNVCDACPADPLNDADVDGLCADADNCPTVANAGQADLDQDGLGNACDSDIDGDGIDNPADCAATTPGVAAPPGDVGPTLRLSKAGSVGLVWQRAAQGHTTNVYRAVGPATAGALMPLSCQQGEIPQLSTTDDDPIPPGGMARYLVISRNVCGDGPLPAPEVESCETLGADSDGDGVNDLADNCVLVANADQADLDQDFVGDACDAD